MTDADLQRIFVDGAEGPCDHEGDVVRAAAGDLSADELRPVLAHVRGCGGCAALWARVRAELASSDDGAAAVSPRAPTMATDAVVPANTSIDMGGISGRDLLSLNLEAGFAIRGGLDEREALEAITVVPARLLGIDHRVGTLEVGKDCDALITDGDLLHYETFVQYTVVEGKLVYDKQEEIFYAHIRPREAVAVDPGEEVIEEAPAEEAVEE